MTIIKDILTRKYQRHHRASIAVIDVALENAMDAHGAELDIPAAMRGEEQRVNYF